MHILYLSLSNESVYVYKEEVGGDGKLTGKSEWSKFKWFSKYTARFNEKNKVKVLEGIEIQIHEDLLRFLVGIQEQFTLVYLTEAFRLKSFYAIRLFEIMLRWAGKGRFVCSVEMYKQYMGIAIDQIESKEKEESSYSNFKYLKRRVLLPSIKAINELPGVNVSVNEIKTGRKVAKLDFDINVDVVKLRVKNVYDKEQVQVLEDMTGDDSITRQNKKSATFDELNVPFLIKFTDAAKLSFYEEFSNYDFSQKEYLNAILAAWEATLETEERKGRKVKNISMRQIGYFTEIIRRKEAESAYQLAMEVE